MITLTTLQWIILITSLNGLIAFAGVLTFILSKKNLQKILLFLVAFATGTLLGGALFHFIPESIEELKITLTIILILTGILIFYVLEKILHWRHCHADGTCDRHPFTYLTLYGDAIHNFLDGLIIAGSFLLSTNFGLITSLLIILHELPQEIGDFGILIYGGFSKKRALFYNFLSQITAIIGGILGFYFLSTINYATYILPLAAGGFLYIAVMDLIPEIAKEKNKIKLIANLIAIILGLLLLITAKLFVG
jgi:zinc and cadmium transporter